MYSFSSAARVSSASTSGPRSRKSFKLRTPSVAFSPIWERGTLLVPLTERKVVPSPMACKARSSHPALPPAADPPRSRQSWAWKCERVSSGVAMAGTAANIFLLIRSCNGASPGCRPNPLSRPISDALGTAIPGLASCSRLSLTGTSMFSPSMPPRRNTTTKVPVCWPGAAKDTREVTSWAPSAMTPTPIPPANSCRREKPRDQAWVLASASPCTWWAIARTAA